MLEIRLPYRLALLFLLITAGFPAIVQHVNDSSASAMPAQPAAVTEIEAWNESASPSASTGTNMSEKLLQASPDPAGSKKSSIVSFKKGNVKIDYDLSSGVAYFFRGGKKIINGFYSAVKLPGLVTSKDYTSRSSTVSGNVYTVTSTAKGMPTMKQHFSLSGTDYFLVSVDMEGSSLSSNWIAPLVMNSKGGMDIGSYKDVIALWIPFDNDRDARYAAASINGEDTSYEASAFYDNSTRNGFVVGSVTHDTWKTGVKYKGSNNRLDVLEVFGGVNISNDEHDGTMKRDSLEHGSISGDRIASPKIFVGFFNDWRNGMEQYAGANADIVPKLEWKGGVPFGWNSWGAVGSKLDTGKALAASDFIKDYLMGSNFENNKTVYINLDSYWDSPSMDLEKFVRGVHSNGQKAGIYWAPFVDWIKDPNRLVEGTDYKYKDVWLKDGKGDPLTYGDGPYALDPTHPGTKKRIDYFISLFKSKGFDEYIKIDFLSHAALEGKHYDPAVTTGMQAINEGLAYFDKTVKSKMGPDTFISSAISPLFPYQYANSRRISCDKFGFLYESRDLLNSLAYGWWMNGSLYSYNDPDHMVLYQVWWEKGSVISDDVAKTRVTSAVISGTVFLSGDDFTAAGAQARAEKYLTNANINKIARSGRAFKPVEGNTGTGSPDKFVMDDGKGGYYVAIFNWDGSNPARKSIDLGRAGLDPGKSYRAVEQWSNTVTSVKKTMAVSLRPGESKIFLLK